MNFYDVEAATGLRFAFNTIPHTAQHHLKYNIPLGFLFSPLTGTPQKTTKNKPTSKCSKCGCLLSPYNTRPRWSCFFCKSLNEVVGQSSGRVVQQQFVVMAGSQTGVIFMVDQASSQKQLQAVVNQLKELLPKLPKNIYIGLISFDKNVFLHNLSSEQPSLTAIDGSSKQTLEELVAVIRSGNLENCKNKYFQPISSISERIQFQLGLLQSTPQVEGMRQQRCLGKALQVASALSQIFSDTNIRFCLMARGPCTVGEGQTIGIPMTETFRSYYDMKQGNDNCKYMSSAQQFYQKIEKTFIFRNSVVDLFAFGLDQFGLHQMKNIFCRTGGMIVMHQSFGSPMFRQSLDKLYSANQQGLFNFALCGRVKLHVNELRVRGVVGNCKSLKVQSMFAGSQDLIGQSGTNQWYIGGIDQSTTLAFYLAHSKQRAQINRQKNAIFQLSTVMKFSDNMIRIRVLNFFREFGNQTQRRQIINNFDQEAAIVLMSKWCSLKAEIEDRVEVIKFMDRVMFKLVLATSDFIMNDKNSLRIPQKVRLYPKLTYHLRRSHFINTFGTSPDECCYYRSTLYRQNVENCCTMILPTLLQYRVDQPDPRPVQLDLDSMKDDIILFLDCYFYVIVWEGRTVHDWRVQKLHQTEEYSYLAQFFDRPYEQVNQVMTARIPVPVKCATFFGDGKERYLKSRVNPSGGSQSENCLSDDVSLKVFMDYLTKTVVTSS